MSTCPAIVKATGIVCGNPSRFGEYCGVHKRVGEEIQRKRDEIAKRISECKGDGTCLDYDDSGWHMCGHCVPVRCPKCKILIEQWVLDCHRGYCMNCAVEEYNKDPVSFMKRM